MAERVAAARWGVVPQNGREIVWFGLEF